MGDPQSWLNSFQSELVEPLSQTAGSVIASLYKSKIYNARSMDPKHNVLLTLHDDELQYILPALNPSDVMSYFLVRVEKKQQNLPESNDKMEHDKKDSFSGSAPATEKNWSQFTTYLPPDVRKDLGLELVQFWLEHMSCDFCKKRFLQSIVATASNASTREGSLLKVEVQRRQRRLGYCFDNDVIGEFQCRHINNPQEMTSLDEEHALYNQVVREQLVAIQLRQLMIENVIIILNETHMSKIENSLPFYLFMSQLGEVTSFLDPMLRRFSPFTNSYVDFISSLEMSKDQDRLTDCHLGLSLEERTSRALALDDNVGLESFTPLCSHHYDAPILDHWLGTTADCREKLIYADTFPDLMVRYFDVVTRVCNPFNNGPCPTLSCTKFFSLNLIKNDYTRQLETDLEMKTVLRRTQSFVDRDILPYISDCLDPYREDRIVLLSTAINQEEGEVGKSKNKIYAPVWRIPHKRVYEMLIKVHSWTKLSPRQFICCVATDSEFDLTIDEHSSLNNLGATLSMMLSSANATREGRTHFALIYAVESTFCVEKYLEIYQRALTQYSPLYTDKGEKPLRSQLLAIHQTFRNLRCEVWCRLCLTLTETFAPLACLRFTMEKALSFANPLVDTAALMRTVLVWFRHFGSSYLEQRWIDDSILPYLPSMSSTVTFDLISYHIETCFERLENLLAVLYLNAMVHPLNRVLLIHFEDIDSLLLESFNLITRIQRLIRNVLQKNVQQTQVRLHAQLVFFYGFKCHMYASMREKYAFSNNFTLNRFDTEGLRAGMLHSITGDANGTAYFLSLEREFVNNLDQMVEEFNVLAITDFTMEAELWLLFCKNSSKLISRENSLNQWILALWEKTQLCHSLQLGNIFFIAGLMQLSVNASSYFSIYNKSQFFTRAYQQYCTVVNVGGKAGGVSYRLELLSALAKMDEIAILIPTPYMYYAEKDLTYGPVDRMDFTLAIQQSLHGLSTPEVKAMFPPIMMAIHHLTTDPIKAMEQYKKSKNDFSTPNVSLNSLAQVILDCVKQAPTYYFAIYDVLNHHQIE